MRVERAQGVAVIARRGQEASGRQQAGFGACPARIPPADGPPERIHPPPDPPACPEPADALDQRTVVQGREGKETDGEERREAGAEGEEARRCAVGDGVRRLPGAIPSAFSSASVSACSPAAFSATVRAGISIVRIRPALLSNQGIVIPGRSTGSSDEGRMSKV